MTEYEAIVLESSGPIARITLNRPDAANAMNNTLLRELADAAYIKAMADDLHRAISTFARMDAVLITAVNGVAGGAGFSLAVTGDLVLAAESASFTMAYTTVGLSPDGSSSFYLPRLIGVRRTQELILTNRALSAAEAWLGAWCQKSPSVAMRAEY